MEAALCQNCEKIIDDVWRKLAINQTFRTPDLYKGVNFKLEEKSLDRLRISPQAISISKSAFTAAIHYLSTNNHVKDSPCEIRSSNNGVTAGPLCIAARIENYGVRCINYVLPILQKSEVVGINPARPNTTWLVK